MSPKDNSGQEYSDSGFWKKLADYAIVAGREVVEKALALYYTAKKPGVPVWAKTTVYSALAYFISPVDAIPDLVPVVGYSDDLGVLAFAIFTLGTHVTDEEIKKAKENMKRWFRGKPQLTD